jgi:hypothetical protein
LGVQGSYDATNQAVNGSIDLLQPFADLCISILCSLSLSLVFLLSVSCSLLPVSVRWLSSGVSQLLVIRAAAGWITQNLISGINLNDFLWISRFALAIWMKKLG